MNPFVQTLQPIWKKPTCVYLNDSALEQLAASLVSDALPVPDWRASVFPADDNSTFINFLGVGNSINFAFTDFKTYQPFRVKYKDTDWTGAFAMWACLLRALESGMNILDGTFLSKLGRPTAGKIFQGLTPIPMLNERIEILRGVGTVLVKKYGGLFSNLFDQANFRAFGGRGIVDRLLSDFPSFVDTSQHRASGRLLEFQKRAQLLPMMYQGRALASSRLKRLPDFEDLGPIADYAVPRALRNVNVLTYSPVLEKRVRERQLISKDSVEEQEIRAQTEHAQWRLLEKLNSVRKTRVTMLSIDFKVWSLGRDAKEPHHLTITTAY